MMPEQLRTRLASLSVQPPSLEKEEHHAAVLVALLPEQPGCPVVLTRRAAKMRHHAGEISLPGGLLDPGDNYDVVQAALREAHEELGLSPAAVAVHSVLPPLQNSRGLHVFPVLGTLDKRPRWRPQPAEVSEILEVPLSFFLSEDHYLPRHRYYRGTLRDTLVMEYEDGTIWGLTARIMRSVSQFLQQP